MPYVYFQDQPAGLAPEANKKSLRSQYKWERNLAYLIAAFCLSLLLLLWVIINFEDHLEIFLSHHIVEHSSILLNHLSLGKYVLAGIVLAKPIYDCFGVVVPVIICNLIGSIYILVLLATRLLKKDIYLVWNWLVDFFDRESVFSDYAKLYVCGLSLSTMVIYLALNSVIKSRSQMRLLAYFTVYIALSIKLLFESIGHDIRALSLNDHLNYSVMAALIVLICSSLVSLMTLLASVRSSAVDGSKLQSSATATEIVFRDQAEYFFVDNFDEVKFLVRTTRNDTIRGVVCSLVFACVFASTVTSFYHLSSTSVPIFKSFGLEPNAIGRSILIYRAFAIFIGFLCAFLCGSTNIKRVLILMVSSYALHVTCEILRFQTNSISGEVALWIYTSYEAIAIIFGLPAFAYLVMTGLGREVRGSCAVLTLLAYISSKYIFDGFYMNTNIFNSLNLKLFNLIALLLLLFVLTPIHRHFNLEDGQFSTITAKLAKHGIFIDRKLSHLHIENGVEQTNIKSEALTNEPDSIV